ncbi:creatininase [Aureimonas frigidaquae]|uniref:Creatininase n=1 Tax=Aureimonas frigidaquae TaxID=424757 RepID=A0A0P0Z1G9_9HYPH|nr:creatininase [Aureimonas frigidaquae]BAT27901.1 creatininase [Aureimonas frigidaquae]
MSDGAAVRLADMTWMEFAERLPSNPIVLLPIGSTEQHGPHLPLATDAILPEEIALRVAERIGGIVAPTLSYGYKSQPKTGGGNHFPGTISLDASTLIALMRDIINDLCRHGIRRIVLFDGHMENQWFITEAADLAIRDQRREGVNDVTILKLGYWEFISAQTEEILFPDGLISWALEHAAVMETSVMLHLRPDLVRADRIPDGPPAAFPLFDPYPFDLRPIPAHGVLSSAASATAEKGRAVLAQVVPDIARALQDHFAA